MVPAAGLEPARDYSPRILSPLCLPFHHAGNDFILAQNTCTSEYKCIKNTRRIIVQFNVFCKLFFLSAVLYSHLNVTRIQHMRYQNQFKALARWIDNTITSINIKKYVTSYLLKMQHGLKQGSIRNILCLSGVAKLLLMYFMIVFYIIIFTFDFSPGVFNQNGSPKIAVYSIAGRIGEHRSYIRTLKAAQKLGWGYVGSSFDESLIHYSWTSHFYKVAANIVNIIVKPCFNLALTHYVNIVPVGYNLTYLNVPDILLYSLKHKFKSEYQHLAQYDAYVDLGSIMTNKNPLLQKVLKNHGKQDTLVIPAYLAYDFEELILPETYQYAVVTGSLWGCNRGSFRFKDAIHTLANDKLLVAYGLEDSFDYLGDSYLGKVEKYGDPGEMLISLQRKGGIALTPHNLEHLVQGIPTSRFAEGIISGSVLISDQHPFLKKYFGDNVLYFDAFVSSEEMYSQIKAHIEWVKAHPTEARQMAQNAYNIFIKDWTLEAQLPKVLEAVKRKQSNS
jgi:hypothetical protein